MKKNVNVFIGVLLCAVLCGTFVWLSSSDDESSWGPNNIYNELQGTASVGGFSSTSAVLSSSSNEGGVALPMSSSSMRARRAPLYAGAYSGAAAMPLASSPLASSPISGTSGAGLHLTSNAEIKSFGGGGNGGAAMSYSQSSISNLQSPIANSQSPIANLQSPIAYSTARRGGMSSVAGDDLAMMATENPVMAMSNAASVGMGTGFYGDYIAMDYSGSANYGQYTGMFGGGSRMGVHGRQNAPTPGSGNTWQTWLLNVWLPSQNGVWGTKGEDGNWYITEEQLRAAYDAFMAGWNSSFDGPTFADWLAWFDPYGSGDGLGIGDKTYYWLPVGDILPLLLIALLYLVFVAIKSKSLKSLLKTERSE